MISQYFVKVPKSRVIVGFNLKLIYNMAFFMRFLKLIEIADVYIFAGLSLIGVGLFFWLGKGIALTVVGLLLFSMGYFSGSVKGK